MQSKYFLGLLATAIAVGSPARAQTVLRDYVASDGLLGVDDAEITPDGRLVVARDNTMSTTARIYDALTGAELALVTTQLGIFSGAVQDAVAVTNDRAVVIGTRCMILDLTNLAAPLMIDTPIGALPRDLEITPDGTMVAIRGGSPDAMGSGAGGLFVFELATGTQVAQAPGLPTDFLATSNYDVDSVGVTNRHAVFTSEVTLTHTRVTVMDLHPAGGGAPIVVYETSVGSDLLGTPYDIAITPNGDYAVIRAELAVGLFRLNGASSHMVWGKRLFGNPGPFGNSAMDSVEVTNDRIATISRWSNGGIGAQVDVFDLAGNQKYERINGDPHDLAITPSGGRLLVRTHTHTSTCTTWRTSRRGSFSPTCRAARRAALTPAMGLAWTR